MSEFEIAWPFVSQDWSTNLLGVSEVREYISVEFLFLHFLIMFTHKFLYQLVSAASYAPDCVYSEKMTTTATQTEMVLENVSTQTAVETAVFFTSRRAGSAMYVRFLSRKVPVQCHFFVVQCVQRFGDVITKLAEVNLAAPLPIAKPPNY